jgi:hypothetical protein
MSAPIKGPLRSTAIDAVTTIAAVNAIFSASSYQTASGTSSHLRHCPVRAGNHNLCEEDPRLKSGHNGPRDSRRDRHQARLNLTSMGGCS